MAQCKLCSELMENTPTYTTLKAAKEHVSIHEEQSIPEKRSQMREKCFGKLMEGGEIPLYGCPNCGEIHIGKTALDECVKEKN